MMIRSTPATVLISIAVMMMMLLLSSVALMTHAHDHDDEQQEEGVMEGIEFTLMSSVKLPFVLSDHTANYMRGERGDEDGFVLLTGGCNSTLGNERLEGEEGEDDLFACLDTSDAAIMFDPFSNTFTEMKRMPAPRQRHAAAAVAGRLYVLGGRDSNDDLVAQVDSYSPVSDTWITHGILPEEILTSDLTAWSSSAADDDDPYIYVTGGFTNNYSAVGTTYRLDTTKLQQQEGDSENTIIPYELLESAPTARGDIHAAEHDGYAYVAGGLSHVSQWCEGLIATERYDMREDTWEQLDDADLDVGRIDMAVAVFNDKIVAVGGETKPDDCYNVTDPAYGSFPADHVEVLDPTTTGAATTTSSGGGGGGGAAGWEQWDEFPDERFRFVAAVVPAQNRMYTFGGQLPFDFTCDCFKTSDDVFVGAPIDMSSSTNDEQTTSESKGLSDSKGVLAAVILGCTIGAVILGFIAYKVHQCLVKKGQEKEAARTGEFKTDGTGA